MAQITNVKTLRKATPTIRIEDNVVEKWNISVEYESADGWKRTYSHTENDLEYLNKTPEQFTENELIGFMNSNMDVIFDAHYQAHNSIPKTQEVKNFNLKKLAK